MNRRNTQTGTSLIEILVSIVIFAVGLSGTAAMSLTSLRSATDGYFNSQATILATELADAMRANLAAYESSKFASTPGPWSENCSFFGAVCTPEEQSKYDSGKWLAHVADELPSGTAVMCVDSTPDDGQPEDPLCDGEGLNTLKIFWFDRSVQEGLAEGESFQRYAVAMVP